MFKLSPVHIYFFLPYVIEILIEWGLIMSLDLGSTMIAHPYTKISKTLLHMFIRYGSMGFYWTLDIKTLPREMQFDLLIEKLKRKPGRSGKFW